MRTARSGTALMLWAVIGLGDVSVGARGGKVALTLPSWRDGDEVRYAEPGSYFLGGGLLPGAAREGTANGVVERRYKGVDEGVVHGPEPEGVVLVGTVNGPIFGPEVEGALSFVGTASGPKFGPEREPKALYAGIDGGLEFGPSEAPLGWGVDEGVLFGPYNRSLFAGVDEGTIYGPEPEPWAQSGGLDVSDIPLPPSRREVPAEYIASYFSAKPKEGLVDPQLLLTEFKRYDIEDFLMYHEDESPYRIHMLMFEGDQELPDGVDLAALHESWYGSKPVLLMAYFMGDPGRAIIEFGRLARDGVSERFLEEAKARCVAQGEVVHNEFNQFERFAMELSVQLFWLERELGLEPPAASRMLELTATSRLVEGDRVPEPRGVKGILAARLAKVRGTVWLALWFAVSTVVGGAVFLWLRERARDREGYWFPDYETETRLGGAHCGGSHGVFFFGRSGGG
ncbi:MAG: hypothetical protein AAGD22_04715 [Verrucomicrobiota bacterium]